MSQSTSRWRVEYLATYFTAKLPVEGLPARFGVITAYNPNGRLVSDAENFDADSKLKQCLEQSGLRHFRVTGMSKDTKHQEPGFGIVVDDRMILEKLSQQFKQEAFFWIEDGEVYCIEAGKPKMHRVGAWSERQIKKL
jgi:hypothetical protein